MYAGIKYGADGGTISNQSTPYSMDTSPSGNYFASGNSGFQYLKDGGKDQKNLRCLVLNHIVNQVK